MPITTQKMISAAVATHRSLQIRSPSTATLPNPTGITKPMMLKRATKRVRRKRSTKKRKRIETTREIKINQKRLIGRGSTQNLK